MKPFNLKEALAGKPVITASGRKVTALHLFNANVPFCLYGIIDDGIWKFTEEGKNRLDGKEDMNDLFMVSEKVTKWVNVYEDEEGEIYTGRYAAGTKEDSEKVKNEEGYIATVPITFEI